MAKAKKSRVKIIKVSDEKCDYRVLGLDCSSSMVGWGLMGIKDNSPILLAYGHVKPLDSKNTLLERLNDVCDNLMEICNEVSPTEVSIEDIILYMKGRSQASTVVILASFNRVVATVIHREFKVGVIFQSVQVIRKLIKKSLKLKETIKKEDMPFIIKEHLCPIFEFTINKKNEIADVTRDEADGIAVAWSRILEKINERPI
jgi:Holliday junction resolvasome RuvABC endonuclease subunit